MPLVVVAPDKWRGSASAAEIAAAISAGASEAGWTVDQAPVSDGGEGFAAALGGRARSMRVHGPLGEQVDAAWYVQDGGETAIVEMAQASGLDLAGGPEHNDPVAASTAGTGELIAAAVKSGARQVLVGLGGSATTDGGWGALEVLEPHSRLAGVEIVAGCDVSVPFVDAAELFAPQKGATPAQVELLARRLERLAQLYEERFGVDVRELPGSGAAGGLGGGLAALGATLMSGFDLVADRVDLAERISVADLVIASEGLLDEQSFRGKAVGGVVGLAKDAGVAVVVLAGTVAEPPPGQTLPVEGVTVLSLVTEVGEDRAWDETLPSLAEVSAAVLRRVPRL